jgi:hypothetical protein
MSACDTAGRHAMEALAAVCAVACLLAFCEPRLWWSLLFAGLAVAAYEASE